MRLLLSSLEGAKLGYQNALTNVASLKEQIDNTIITAPFDGYVTSRSIELGALMVPSMPVMSIAQQNDLLFVLDLVSGCAKSCHWYACELHCRCI